MTRRRSHPSRIPPRPPVLTPTPSSHSREDEGGISAPRLRTGHETARRWQQSLSGIPRVGRMLIAGVFALALALMVFPQVDALYLDYLFTPETIIIPSYVTGAVGIGMYIAGWWLIVGPRGQPQGEQVSRHPALIWYIGIGMIAVIVSAVLLIHGLTLTEAVAG